MLNDEYVIEQLKKRNLWDANNCYFLGKIIKSKWKTAIEWTNFYANLFSKETFAIVNETNEGICIMPMEMKADGLIPIENSEHKITNSNIDFISIKKSFMSKKVTIVTVNHEVITLSVEAKNSRIKEHEAHFKSFLSQHDK